MDRLTGKRVAIVARNAAGLSGTATTVLEHARRLSDTGSYAHIIAERIDRQRLVGGGHPIPRLPFGRNLRRSFFSSMAGLVARSLRSDLVFGHGDILKQDLLSLHNCVHLAHEKIHQAPLPASSSVGRFHQRLLKNPQNFRHVIANSQLMADDLTARYAIPAEKITVIYPGYNATKFCVSHRERWRSDTRTALGVGSKLLVGLITSGDFTKRGVPQFIDALALLDDHLLSNLAVVIIGSEKKQARYRAHIARLGLTQHVRLLEPTPTIERYFHALDLYVHPALFEEFGQSVQEAMVCGIPTLTTRYVGAAECFPKEVQSTLLQEVTPTTIAAGLTNFLVSEKLRESWQENTHASFVTNNWDQNFVHTRRVLEHIGE